MADQNEHERAELTTLRAVVEHAWGEQGLTVEEQPAAERLRVGLKAAAQLIDAIENFAGMLESSVPHDGKLYSSEDRGWIIRQAELASANSRLRGAVLRVRVEREPGVGITVGREGNSLWKLEPECRRASKGSKINAEGSPQWWSDQFQTVMRAPLYAEAEHAHRVLWDLRQTLDSIGAPEDTPDRLRVLAGRLRQAIDQTVTYLDGIGIPAKKPTAGKAMAGLSSAELQRICRCSQSHIRSIASKAGVRALKRGDKYTTADLRKMVTCSADWTPGERSSVVRISTRLEELGVNISRAQRKAP